MITIITQNLAIINMDNITSIYADTTDDGRIILAADQKYILGHFNTEEDVLKVILYIINTIGRYNKDTNLNIMIPQADKVNEDIDNATND